MGVKGILPPEEIDALEVMSIHRGILLIICFYVACTGGLNADPIQSYIIRI